MRLRASRTFVVEPALPPALHGLRRLASNLYWTWNTDAAALFTRIDPALWETSHHNPVLLLQRARQDRWDELAADEGFVAHLDRVSGAFEAYLAREPLLNVDGASEQEPVAYFSLEFALTESLPNYSGGLGVLAGDHLKSASDLGIPLVGVGLFYHLGYFHQRLGPDGWQQEDYRQVDTTLQPLQPIHGLDGSRVRVEVPLDGRTAVAELWRLDVGKVPLYLLDTDVEPNISADRELTSRLYGGDTEMRIQQEIILGIGGVRALKALGLAPVACHMNEGHSALLGLERIRTLMQEGGVSFAEARQPVTAATVFTTHTAVAAGIDLFPPDLVMRYLGEYAAGMGLDQHALLGLGRTNPSDDAEPFSMAMLGLRLSGFRNGVSKLHRGVSRRLWESAWPAIPLEQTPIDSITNGVHLPTWVCHEIGDLYDRYVGPGWRDDPAAANWARIAEIPDEELWRVHEREREKLVARARKQHAEALMSRGLSSSAGSSGQALDPGCLPVIQSRADLWVQVLVDAVQLGARQKLGASAYAVLAGVLFIFASSANQWWPWKISTFLAQLYSGPLLAYGLASLGISRSRNWEDGRLALAAMTAFAILTLIGSSQHTALFVFWSPSAILWFGGFGAAAMILGYLTLRAYSTPSHQLTASS